MLKLGWKDDSNQVHLQMVSTAVNIDLTSDIADAFQLNCYLMCLLAVYVRTHCELRVTSFTRVDCSIEKLCKA